MLTYKRCLFFHFLVRSPKISKISSTQSQYSYKVLLVKSTIRATQFWSPRLIFRHFIFFIASKKSQLKRFIAFRRQKALPHPVSIIYNIESKFSWKTHHFKQILSHLTASPIIEWQDSSSERKTRLLCSQLCAERYGNFAFFGSDFDYFDRILYLQNFPDDADIVRFFMNKHKSDYVYCYAAQHGTSTAVLL